MQIAVRSYLTAGAVAVVGAGSIALAPPVPSINFAAMPAPVVADVTLTGVSLSLDQIVTVLGKLGLGDVITPIVNLLPTNLVNNFVAEFSDQALALVKATVTGVLSDFSSVVTGLIVGPSSFVTTAVTALASLPSAVFAAVKTLGNGDLSATLQTLVAPLTDVGNLVIDAVKTFAGKVVGRLGDLVNAVPNLLVNVVQAVVTNDFNSVVDMVKKAIAGITKAIGAASVPAAAAVAPVAVAPVAAALAVAPSALAVAPSAVSALPASVAVTPRGMSRADRAAARAQAAAAATPKPAAAEAAPVETAAPADVPVPARVEEAVPSTTSAPAAAPRSKAAGHSRAATGRAAKVSTGE